MRWDTVQAEPMRGVQGRQDLELYRVLVENSLGLMCIHDLEGVLIAINPAVAESLEYRVSDGVGRNLREFLKPSVQHLFGSYLERIQRNGSDSGLMHLLTSSGQERIWFYRNIRFDAYGDRGCVLGHALDVTERIRSNRALRESQRELRRTHDELAARVAERTQELEEANRRLREEAEERRRIEMELIRTRKIESLGVLAGGIAHEFNNIFTVIQGNLALARMNEGVPGEAQSFLSEIDVACQKATELTSRLLTFAKGGTPVRQTLTIDSVLRGAVESLDCHPSQISIDIASDLWAADIDREQIRQVFLNVLQNAYEASGDGGRVEVVAENHEAGVDASSNPPVHRFIRVRIRDFGQGIPPENLERIFDPYFSTKREGGGLGLATAYSIVSKHQGHIKVDSAPGRGSDFQIFLPAAKMTPIQTKNTNPQPHSGAGRILVMDDEEAIRTLMMMTLKRLGYDASCVKDGEEAIEAYEQSLADGKRFAAVLLDLTVPGGMGGKEAAERLRQIDPTAKLIVSSGYSEAPVLSNFKAYGFDDVILKPWTLAKLTEVLERITRPSTEQ